MSALEHSLGKHFPDLCKANSTEELLRLPAYVALQSQVEEILETVIEVNEGSTPVEASEEIRATAWNIERGIELGGIVEVLSEHPVISKSDLFFLTELDYGMVRSQNLRIPHELAKALDLNFAFAPSYINLEKGSGLESEVEGENLYGIHGNALLSRFPIREAHSILLPNGKDKMAGREKRLGQQRGVAAIIDHPSGPVRAVSVHLDAHSTQKHRMRQMQLVLDDLDQFHPELPALIGGDWNTSTYNSRNAFFSIMGYTRRVLMGVRHVIRTHYPYPDRWFERHLFRELERRGFDYKGLNEPGGCTLHYDVNDLAANGRMADWIPNWCFWFIRWALEKNNGRCSMKLDWFAGKKVQALKDSPPRVIPDVNDPKQPLSDHDPIVLDFKLA
ncbi:MAG: hypothetical protein JSU96_05530 [Acidobacteriota bacterium]|nr:MAG: hypothetical protein JSU96_05530 [Acidobacteriota bacterium]